MLPEKARILPYLSSASLEDIKDALVDGKSDPNDLIAYGSLLFDQVYGDGLDEETRSDWAMKAELLIRTGIYAIDNAPDLLEGDIDLTTAYCQYASLLWSLGQSGKSHAVLQRAITSGCDTEEIDEVIRSFPPIPPGEKELGQAVLEVEILQAKAIALFQGEHWARAVSTYESVAKGHETIIEKWPGKIVNIERDYANVLSSLALSILQGPGDMQVRAPQIAPLLVKALALDLECNAAKEVFGLCIEWVLDWHRYADVEIADFRQYDVWERACSAGHDALKQRNYRGAARHYSSAVPLRPETDFVWHGLGLASFALGDMEQAINAFKNLYDLSPDYDFCVRRKPIRRRSSALEARPPKAVVTPKKGLLARLFGK